MFIYLNAWGLPGRIPPIDAARAISIIIRETPKNSFLIISLPLIRSPRVKTDITAKRIIAETLLPIGLNAASLIKAGRPGILENIDRDAKSTPRERKTAEVKS